MSGCVCVDSCECAYVRECVDLCEHVIIYIYMRVNIGVYIYICGYVCLDVFVCSPLSSSVPPFWLVSFKATSSGFPSCIWVRSFPAAPVLRKPSPSPSPSSTAATAAASSSAAAAATAAEDAAVVFVAVWSVTSVEKMSICVVSMLIGSLQSMFLVTGISSHNWSGYCVRS
jgi:hypothetical protein